MTDSHEADRAGQAALKLAAGYKVGQVFERLGIASYMPAKYVVVCEVRGEDHEKGLGHGLPSALALPWDPRMYVIQKLHLSADPLSYSPEARVEMVLQECHVFDTVILCRELLHHGDEVWRLVSDDERPTNADWVRAAQEGYGRSDG